MIKLSNCQNCEKIFDVCQMYSEDACSKPCQDIINGKLSMHQQAYKQIVEVAYSSGVMHHRSDDDGFDEFIKLLESGEFRLVFESLAGE